MVSRLKFTYCKETSGNYTAKDNEELKLDVDTIVEGNINAWQSRLRISVNLPKDQDWIDKLREMRDKTPERLSGVFHQWQTEKYKTFNDWFEEERMSIGKTILQVYFSHLKKWKKIFVGYNQPTVDDLSFLPSASIWIRSIHSAFEKARIQDSEIWPKTIEHLTSPSLKNAPFISGMVGEDIPNNKRDYGVKFKWRMIG